MTTTRSRPTLVHARVVAISVSVALASTGIACSAHRTADEQNRPDAVAPSRRMPDGREWTTENLGVHADPSYCYDGAEANCRRYGRLYTWESALRACRSLGNGWRLPTSDDWRRLAKRYGGVSDDSDDRGKAAYGALMAGGGSGFNAVLGGGRDPGSDQYARIEAHGFYWTATEGAPGTAWFYNFAKGGLALHAQSEGEKERAFSVRCVRE